MGKPTESYVSGPHIVGRSPCELKHLSTKGKEINKEIPLVVASERGKAQTISLLMGL